MRLLLLLAVLLLADGDGKKKGRQGNALYEREQYAEAAARYREGVRTLGEAQGPVASGLWNNLGAARFRMEEAEAAREAFAAALTAATSDADYARAAYNAGNAAYAAQDLDAALDYYRRALLAEPDHADAKFNYEFVKRQRDQQQQQQGGQQGNQNPQQGDGGGDQQQDGEDQQQQQDGQDERQGPEQQQDQPPLDDEAGPEQQQEQGRSQPQTDQLSREQALRILQALQTEEEQLLREVQQRPVRSRRVEKDW